MGIRELEIIDIGTDGQDVRRTERRSGYRREKGQKTETWMIEEWEEDSAPEEEWETEEDDEDWEEDQWYDDDWEDEADEEQKFQAARHQPRLKQYQAAGRRAEEFSVVKRRTKAELEAEKPDIYEEKQRRKRRRRRARMVRGAITAFAFVMLIGVLLTAAWLAVSVYKGMKEGEAVQTAATADIEEIPKQDIREWARFYAMELERPDLAVDLLTVNEYSRPGEELPEVKSIFIHYTANAGTTAQQNRSYFESLSESHERSASAHFVIGYDGVIVQCIPTKEIAYAVKGRNYDSISIECCYLEENGKFEEETYRSLIGLTAWLLHKYELRPENVLRHYDEGGKNCPKYYVEHEEAWDRFLADLESYMISVTEEGEKNGI